MEMVAGFVSYWYLKMEGELTSRKGLDSKFSSRSRGGFSSVDMM